MALGHDCNTQRRHSCRRAGKRPLQSSRKEESSVSASLSVGRMCVLAIAIASMVTHSPVASAKSINRNHLRHNIANLRGGDIGGGEIDDKDLDDYIDFLLAYADDEATEADNPLFKDQDVAPLLGSIEESTAVEEEIDDIGLEPMVEDPHNDTQIDAMVETLVASVDDADLDKPLEDDSSTIVEEEPAVEEVATPEPVAVMAQADVEEEPAVESSSSSSESFYLGSSAVEEMPPPVIEEETLKEAEIPAETTEDSEPKVGIFGSLMQKMGLKKSEEEATEDVAIVEPIAEPVEEDATNVEIVEEETPVVEEEVAVETTIVEEPIEEATVVVEETIELDSSESVEESVEGTPEEEAPKVKLNFMAPVTATMATLDSAKTATLTALGNTGAATMKTLGNTKTATMTALGNTGAATMTAFDNTKTATMTALDNTSKSVVSSAKSYYQGASSVIQGVWSKRPFQSQPPPERDYSKIYQKYFAADQEEEIIPTKSSSRLGSAFLKPWGTVSKFLEPKQLLSGAEESYSIGIQGFVKKDPASEDAGVDVEVVEEDIAEAMTESTDVVDEPEDAEVITDSIEVDVDVAEIPEDVDIIEENIEVEVADADEVLEDVEDVEESVEIEIEVEEITEDAEIAEESIEVDLDVAMIPGDAEIIEEAEIVEAEEVIEETEDVEEIVEVEVEAEEVIEESIEVEVEEMLEEAEVIEEIVEAEGFEESFEVDVEAEESVAVEVEAQEIIEDAEIIEESVEAEVEAEEIIEDAEIIEESIEIEVEAEEISAIIEEAPEDIVLEETEESVDSNEDMKAPRRPFLSRVWGTKVPAPNAADSVEVDAETEEVTAEETLEEIVEVTDDAIEDDETSPEEVPRKRNVFARLWGVSKGASSEPVEDVDVDVSVSIVEEEESLDELEISESSGVEDLEDDIDVLQLDEVESEERNVFQLHIPERQETTEESSQPEIESIEVDDDISVLEDSSESEEISVLQLHQEDTLVDEDEIVTEEPGVTFTEVDEDDIVEAPELVMPAMPEEVESDESEDFVEELDEEEDVDAEFAMPAISEELESEEEDLVEDLDEEADVDAESIMPVMPEEVQSEEEDLVEDLDEEEDEDAEFDMPAMLEEVDSEEEDLVDYLDEEEDVDAEFVMPAMPEDVDSDDLEDFIGEVDIEVPIEEDILLEKLAMDESEEEELVYVDEDEYEPYALEVELENANFVTRFLVNKGLEQVIMVAILISQWFRAYILAPILDSFDWVKEGKAQDLIENVMKTRGGALSLSESEDADQEEEEEREADEEVLSEEKATESDIDTAESASKKESTEQDDPAEGE